MLEQLEPHKWRQTRYVHELLGLLFLFRFIGLCRGLLPMLGSRCVGESFSRPRRGGLPRVVLSLVLHRNESARSELLNQGSGSYCSYNRGAYPPH